GGVGALSQHQPSVARSNIVLPGCSGRRRGARRPRQRRRRRKATCWLRVSPTPGSDIGHEALTRLRAVGECTHAHGTAALRCNRRKAALTAWHYREEATFFVRALRSGEPFPLSGDDTLTDVRLYEELY